ncbi:hypothetical protein L1887_52531 [Cichorium endivia]|nr:hypothetical protein L1887_52531 [Cichorium endivia]
MPAIRPALTIHLRVTFVVVLTVGFPAQRFRKNGESGCKKREKNMDLYKEYPAHIVFLRRAFAVVAGVLALPVMLFWKDRARFYSYLHRVWAKTSEKPVWMDQAEKATCDFY